MSLAASPHSLPSEPSRPLWTCPFCPLLCDEVDPAQPAAADCALLQQRLAEVLATPEVEAGAAAWVAGQPCDLATAVAAAAAHLANSRQPLLAGMGTDVAGARALYRLAAHTGAICDAAHGESLMQSQRALQDHGGYSSTLGELRERADLIVFVGGLQRDLAPRLWRRCGIGQPIGVAPALHRHIVLLGPAEGDLALLQGLPHTRVSSLPLHGGLPALLAQLAMLVRSQPQPAAAPQDGDAPPAAPGTPDTPDHAALARLAAQLHGARYAVFVGASARLPAHGALLIEQVQRLVGELNRRGRAASLWLGGSGGTGTANQVFTWLSGLPLRSRAGPAGLEHSPQRFASARLLADGAVDVLLWVSSLDATAQAPLPPAGQALPCIYLAPPALAPRQAMAPQAIYIPVAMPGIDSAGHLLRTDGTVVKPLFALRPSRLPGVAEVASRLLDAVLRQRAMAGGVA